MRFQDYVATSLSSLAAGSMAPSADLLVLIHGGTAYHATPADLVTALVSGGQLGTLAQKNLSDAIALTAAGTALSVTNNVTVGGALSASGGLIGASGATASRPASPVTAQQYFDTTLGQPIWYLNGTGWVNAAGAVV